MKWAIKLSEFDILYRQRSTIKGQVLIDFITKLSDISGDNLSDRLWILKTDGSSKRARDEAGVVLQFSEGQLIAQLVQFSFLISNNEAKF